jgi:hypothetical protein
MYTPSDVPVDTAQVGDFLRRELLSIAQSFQAQAPFLLLKTLYVAPAKPREGLIVLADGTSWNPGAGAGFYGYRGAAWHLLG